MSVELSWSEVEARRNEQRMAEVEIAARKYMERPAQPEAPQVRSYAQRVHSQPRPAVARRPHASAQRRVGEITLKEFCNAEAELAGVGWMAIYQRVMRGKYPGLILRRVNQRVVFVTQAGEVNHQGTKVCGSQSRAPKRGGRR